MINEKAVLVHGYWISPGADLLSLRQADAAARAYLKGEVNLILIPAGAGEWGQRPISEFIRDRILQKYPQVSPARIISFNDKSIVNTKKEVYYGLKYLKERGIITVTDLAAPFHSKRIKWIFDESLRGSLNQNSEFYLQFKTTDQYLTPEEADEYLNSQTYRFCEKGEELRLFIFKNKILNFFADLIPDEVKSMLEACIARRVKKAK